jgi:hypothetical protein
MDLKPFFDELVCLPFIERGGRILRLFCSSALWKICEILYLLFRMQKCRFTTPSQEAGVIVLSQGDGILTHQFFSSPDPIFP